MGNVQNFSGNVNDILIIQEIAAGFEVPYWPGVDVAAIAAAWNDTDPVFVTLPIGQAGSISGNGREYGRDVIQEIERQAAENKPIGLMGHLSAAQRASEFPKEAVQWVGAAWDGDTLIGKAYIVPGEARSRIQAYKAQGKKIATSIDAFAQGVWDEARKVTKMVAKTFRLNQIDIAPADRAGIASLAAIPILTTEMEQGEQPEQPGKGQKMPITEQERFEVITEMKPADLKLLPEPVKQAVIDAQPKPAAIEQVQELCTVLGVTDPAQLKGVVTEMVKAQGEARQAAIKARIVEMATPNPAITGADDLSIKVDDVRGLVVEMVALHSPQTVAEAESAYKTVIASDTVKNALKGRVADAMGPNQSGGGVSRQHGQEATGKTGQYMTIPERKQAASN